MEEKKAPPRARHIPLKRRLAEGMDLPAEAFGGVSEILLHFSDNAELTVSECKRILTYIPEEICLKLRRGRVTVRGYGLELYACGNGGVQMRGEIREVVFENTARHGGS